MISYSVFCFKKIRRPTRSTLSSSSAASDVYKRQGTKKVFEAIATSKAFSLAGGGNTIAAVSYTHLRAHETRHDLVFRLLLQKDTATNEIYTILFVGSVRCV